MLVCVLGMACMTIPGLYHTTSITAGDPVLAAESPCLLGLDERPQQPNRGSCGRVYVGRVRVG